jgi:hypothetical protein
MKTGIATFTLDYGKCPPWLYERMVRLGREMARVIVAEYGPDEFVKRLADPVWFQSLGTVLAFDWNASGLTTILTAALKEAIRGQEKDLGIFICGGKGKTSLKTPDEIENWGIRLDFSEKRTRALVYNSRMSAKVDSSLVQDGFQIYHHCFCFSRSGAWTVIQQGMNTTAQTARRYHWFSEKSEFAPPPAPTSGGLERTLVREPHSAVFCETLAPTLNLVAAESEKTRNLSSELVQAGYNTLMKDIQLLRKHSSTLHQMAALKIKGRQLTLLNLENTEFKSHPVIAEDFSKSRYLDKILRQVCEKKPENYEKILAERGVGPKTMRALALVGEIIYGARPSFEDPARYSFAHGGKDATPYPVDRPTYDSTISLMRELVNKSKISVYDKNRAIRRLNTEN